MTADPSGLMAFWADIEPSYEPRFLEWHNCEHMPERVAVPGFVEGRRYHGMDGAPAYLMMYFTETADVLQSPAYMERLNDPTPWTRESLTHFRNASRNIYDLSATAGDASLNAAPYLVSIRFNLAQPTGAIADELLPAWSALSGVGRVRFYAINAAISGIETAERGIYGGGPGQQPFLLFVECAALEVAESAPWRAAWSALPSEARPADVIQENFWIDYALAAA